MWGLSDSNADGAEGTIPYIYLDFCRFIWCGSGELRVSSRICRVEYIGIT